MIVVIVHESAITNFFFEKTSSFSCLRECGYLGSVYDGSDVFELFSRIILWGGDDGDEKGWIFIAQTEGFERWADALHGREVVDDFRVDSLRCQLPNPFYSCHKVVDVET